MPPRYRLVLHDLHRAGARACHMVRVSLTAWRAWRGRVRGYWPTVLLGMRWALIAPLYLSFAGYLHAWRICEPHIRQVLGVPTSSGQRLLFCLLLSWLLGHGLLRQMAIPVSWSTLLLCTAHALVVHYLGSRGRRWCKRQLGFRPARHIDPEKPFAGLDFGN